MTTAPDPRSRRLAAAAWRIALALLPLGAGLFLVAGMFPPSEDPSAPGTLGARIAAGIVISAASLAVIALLVRVADRRRMSEAGLTSVRTGWRLALWGAFIWTVPSAATFGVLALLGSPLTATLTGPELARTVLLLLMAVLLSEAIPEEAVFRGYVTTVLGTLTRGWGVIVVQALLFTLLAAILRQNADPADLSLFLSMGIGFGYLRMVTGSVWMPIGFHTAFQTGSQLVLSQDAVGFAGGTGAAMLALGVIPFSVAAILVSSTGIPRIVHPGPDRSS
ncbi:CAAX protease [Brachybacterium phenoliresistens]|uniref:CAAX protease n=1 Tax=Brachybacterium phenoliresistens TaxID=396014 RepID=Z9JY56_9MICO|nr:type II CAAX endopeptidase family protein [Brachybacterium phenoliresistens]EWS82938.1 CAAX protease [Brachybacterium phenoliresistens]